MNNKKLFPQKKNIAVHSKALTEAEIYSMELKLNDPKYIDGAIYRLASIIADRILSGEVNYE